MKNLIYTIVIGLAITIISALINHSSKQLPKKKTASLLFCCMLGATIVGGWLSYLVADKVTSEIIFFIMLLAHLAIIFLIGFTCYYIISVFTNKWYDRCAPEDQEYFWDYHGNSIHVLSFLFTASLIIGTIFCYQTIFHKFMKEAEVLYIKDGYQSELIRVRANEKFLIKDADHQYEIVPERKRTAVVNLSNEPIYLCTKYYDNLSYEKTIEPHSFINYYFKNVKIYDEYDNKSSTGEKWPGDSVLVLMNNIPKELRYNYNVLIIHHDLSYDSVIVNAYQSHVFEENNKKVELPPLPNDSIVKKTDKKEIQLIVNLSNEDLVIYSQSYSIYESMRFGIGQPFVTTVPSNDYIRDNHHISYFFEKAPDKIIVTHNKYDPILTTTTYTIDTYSKCPSDIRAIARRNSKK